MKIVLFGYGKMGKMVAKTAIQRDHTILKKLGVQHENSDISQADVAIDFSVPSAALANISLCLEHGIPIVSGTTGWLDDYDSAVALCKKKNGAFIHAANFSLGVHLFFQINEYIAKLMEPFSQYNVTVEETHHIHKLDAPSGTAITIAETIIDHTSKTHWELGNAPKNGIPITAKRVSDTPGIHTVNYTAPTDTITIQHRAHNREGFALGAVIAAEWILGKKGVYTMKDVLSL